MNTHIALFGAIIAFILWVSWGMWFLFIFTLAFGVLGIWILLNVRWLETRRPYSVIKEPPSFN